VSTVTADIEVRPLTAAIGAEVHGIDLRDAPYSDAIMRRLEQAVYEHMVLFFRDQQMTPQQQVDFGRWFGELEIHPFAIPHPDYPAMVVLDQTAPEKDGANRWHTDASFMVGPSALTILRAVQLPPLGGDTCWASMYAAYDALSEPVREMLDGLTAIHDLIGPLERAVATGHSIAGMDELRARWPVTEHPVIRTHPKTGRKLLYVNSNFTTRINGLTEAENARLLPFLIEHVRSPDFQCRFRWAPGSVAFWDNRCTQHYAVADYNERRVMHRVTVAGERPA
jgi:taurine dioxygenase